MPLGMPFAKNTKISYSGGSILNLINYEVFNLIFNILICLAIECFK